MSAPEVRTCRDVNQAGAWAPLVWSASVWASPENRPQKKVKGRVVHGQSESTRLWGPEIITMDSKPPARGQAAVGKLRLRETNLQGHNRKGLGGPALRAPSAALRGCRLRALTERTRGVEPGSRGSRGEGQDPDVGGGQRKRDPDVGSAAQF